MAGRRAYKANNGTKEVGRAVSWFNSLSPHVQAVVGLYGGRSNSQAIDASANGREIHHLHFSAFERHQVAADLLTNKAFLKKVVRYVQANHPDLIKPK